MFEILRGNFGRQDRVKSISPEELKIKLQSGRNVFLIDVCEPYEYALGCIEGAQNIPLGMLERTINENNDVIKHDDEIVIYCAHGIRSRHAAKKLEEMGFNNVYSLSGGFAAFKTNY